MDDKDFLVWMHERLQHQHGENPLYVYMFRLRAIIAATPPKQRSEIDFTLTSIKETLEHGT